MQNLVGNGQVATQAVFHLARKANVMFADAGQQIRRRYAAVKGDPLSPVRRNTGVEPVVESVRGVSTKMDSDVMLEVRQGGEEVFQAAALPKGAKVEIDLIAAF